MNREIDEIEEEIAEVECDGEQIYEMCRRIIEEFGSSEYSDWREQAEVFVKLIAPFTVGTATVFRTEHNEKELEIKKSYDVSVIEVYYGNKLVFSGQMHGGGTYSWIDLNKVIIYEWVEKINEWANRARRQREERRDEEKRKRLMEKKEKFRRKCDCEVEEMWIFK